MTVLISHAGKVMLKILQARLQQYLNQELPYVQAGFRRGRRARDQIANIHCIIEKARKFHKKIYFCFIDYIKAFDCVDHDKLQKILQEVGIPDHLGLPPEKSVCRSRSNIKDQTWKNGLAANWERSMLRLYIVTLLT